PIFEPLVTLNENHEPQPMLAESYELSEDGKTYTFVLREGVKFHNSKEMKSDDVVASMDRWASTVGTVDVNIGEHEWKIIDDYTVELNVREPSNLVPSYLSALVEMPAIMPKEINEEADETGVKEFIGTGPFKLE